jgi:hypothetical protein
MRNSPEAFRRGLHETMRSDNGGLALSRSQDELFRQSVIPKSGNRFSEKIVLCRNI